MEKVIRALKLTPAFLAEMFSEHPVISVIGLLIFLSALIISGRLGSFIRKIVILANILFAMAGGFMGRSQHGQEIICLSAIALIILFIVRRIVRIAGVIKNHRDETRIRKRAHALAAKRRHKLKHQQQESRITQETNSEDSQS